MNPQPHTAIARALAVPQSDCNLNRRIPAAAVCNLCGGVSDMTLWRWLNDDALAFPRPVYIGRRRYWREAEILAWLESREGVA